jgi:hypothetical protein
MGLLILGSWFCPALCYIFLHASSMVFPYEKTEQAFCIELGSRNGGKV